MCTVLELTVCAPFRNSARIPIDLVSMQLTYIKHFGIFFVQYYSYRSNKITYLKQQIM